MAVHVPEGVAEEDVNCALDFVEYVRASSYNVPVKAVLTDNGKEFTTHWKGRCHDFEFFLKMNGIGHHYTKVRHPWTNGFTKRLNRTILEEFLQVALRKTRYYSVKQLQDDLDHVHERLQFHPPHQSYRLKGSTPAERFLTTTKAA